MRVTSLAGVVVLVFLTITALTAQQKNPLTNADVIKMVKAGLVETAIVAAIAANDTQFDLSSTGLQALNQAGASSKVIRAMLAAESKKKERCCCSGGEFDACAGCDHHPGIYPRGIVGHEPPGDAAGNVTGPDGTNDGKHAS